MSFPETRLGEITLYATCIAVGEDGILIRGASGSGKSSLALDLIARATRANRFARLVCDDRVRVSARSDRLIARAVPSIAGRVEVRGVGIVEVPYEPTCILRVVVDLDENAHRMPEPEADHAEILGVMLLRLRVDRDTARCVLGAGGARSVFSSATKL